MTTPLVLALDQGTTSSRSLLFNHAGDVVASAQQALPPIYPQPGWVEHDPRAIWQTQLATMKDVLTQARVLWPASRVTALGITNQRETTLLWDRATGEPLANAVVWQDRRTAAACDALRGKAPRIQQLTGLVLDAYFSASKLAWLLDHVPGARARAARGELAFGTVDSWLIYQLTAGRVHATDVSNASRTMLFDIHRMAWSTEMLTLWDIPPSVLPQVVASSGVLGVTDAGVLGQEIAIAGVAGDQQAATFGQACFAPGMAKNTYGTGCFMLMNTGDTAVPSRQRLLTTVGWQGGAGAPAGLKKTAKHPHHTAQSATAYCLEGSVFMGGATVQWLRDGLGLIEHAPQVEALAASVPDCGDVMLVPAFAGLGAPHWDAYARGTLLGLTRDSGRAHIARAALEAIALQSADVFAAMSQDSGVPLRELRVDGGAAANNLLMQMQADLTGVPVLRPKVTETTALGAAYLAGLATGFWADANEITANWQLDRRFEPQMSESQRQSKLNRWHEGVARSRAWAR
jgi:glycerol kinase